MGISRTHIQGFSEELAKIAAAPKPSSVIKALKNVMFLRRGTSRGLKPDMVVDEASEYLNKLKRRPGEGVISHNVRKGWEDLGGPQGAGGGWLGKKDTWRRKLPIGGKSLFTAATLAALPGALKKHDKYFPEQSNVERTSRLGAGTLGGLLGSGVFVRSPGSKLKVPGKLRLPAYILGGIGGAMAGEYAAGAPFSLMRKTKTNKPLIEGARELGTPERYGPNT